VKVWHTIWVHLLVLVLPIYFWKVGLTIVNNPATQRAFRPMVDILSMWWWSRLVWHDFIKVADNWMKNCSPAWIGTHNRHVKFGLKTPSRLGKNVRKTQAGDFFLTHTVHMLHCRDGTRWALSSFIVFLTLLVRRHERPVLGCYSWKGARRRQNRCVRRSYAKIYDGTGYSRNLSHVRSSCSCQSSVNSTTGVRLSCGLCKCVTEILGGNKEVGGQSLNLVSWFSGK